MRHHDQSSTELCDPFFVFVFLVASQSKAGLQYVNVRAADYSVYCNLSPHSEMQLKFHSHTFHLIHENYKLSCHSFSEADRAKHAHTEVAH